MDLTWGSATRSRGVDVLLGKTLASVQRIGDEAIDFLTTEDTHFRMMHLQDCCESVHIESVVGDLQDLVGAPLLKAEEVVSKIAPQARMRPTATTRSQTWTFYKLATRKGYVDIRWFGASTGFYSETVCLVRLGDLA